MRPAACGGTLLSMEPSAQSQVGRGDQCGGQVGRALLSDTSQQGCRQSEGGGGGAMWLWHAESVEANASLSE